eukprot:gene10572-biopygen19539
MPQSGYPILYASQAFCALFGYPLAEVLGKNPRLLQGNHAQGAGAGLRVLLAPRAVGRLSRPTISAMRGGSPREPPVLYCSLVRW